MSSPKIRGTCPKCGKDFANAGMGKHLGACFVSGPALHVAFDVGPGIWWIHVAVGPSATLRDVDSFLRAIWLECCGHMSAFDIGGTRYEPSTDGWDDFGYGPKPKSMQTKAATALRVGETFHYEYDFGSTTGLRGRVVGAIAAGSKNVSVIARNAEIKWPCETCGNAATRVCPQCFAMGCKTCKAPCACLDSFKEESLPVVNSPRMGVCAYGG